MSVKRSPGLHDPFRTAPAYSISEAARYAGTTPATVRRWIKGYDSAMGHMEPVFEDKDSADGSTPRLSFLDLAEIIVAVKFTQLGGKLDKVRFARGRAHQKWPALQYPFASLRMKAIGGELLHVVDEEYGGMALALSIGGPHGDQYVLPNLVAEALDLFEFDKETELAIRWFPAGRDSAVVVDPRFAGGRPTIKGRGVTVDSIFRRWTKGGEKQRAIADDLELSVDEVEDALRFAAA
jgi:uncharacterized protein (DUF433 family)